jgi:cytochrome c oxidase subunit IV
MSSAAHVADHHDTGTGDTHTGDTGTRTEDAVQYPLFDAHDRQYLLVALGLASLTAIEVVMSYTSLKKASLALPILALAAIKFIIVAAFFMHLKLDSPVLRRLFILGAVLAGFCYMAVLSAFGVFHGFIHWIIYAGFALLLLVKWVFSGGPSDEAEHDHPTEDHLGHASAH